ncbi:DNA primase [Novimethylophilus kurashikiensis]|uniref:DNA primase n=1 Tax=Novimethylophilus kurashikiensis TaxID=1825523 RepID=A0A2R5F939_9PROT|nr:hypothetical protein [Novimethylophilus kurashikiensis]GBG13144.1 DNA primase [Novimethylophilus kurashikiensis]
MNDKYPVFRVVDGKEVQISLQDLKRPHKTVCDVATGMVRIIELTEEEMAQQQADKEAWDTGEQERTERERKEAEEQERFLDSLRYDSRLVAFIDILGWSKAVNSSAKNGADTVKALGQALIPLKAFTNFIGTLESIMPETGWPGDPVMSHFSDSVVLTVKDDVIGRQHLLQALHALSASMIRHGFLLRGGIARGDVYHRNGIIFGPAFIEAHLLEKDIAFYPRIILSPELSQETEGWRGVIDQPWRKDSDGLTFFNFLPPFYNNQFLKDNSELWQSQLIPIRTLIIDQVSRHRNDKNIYSKYQWLAKYFDDICTENPQSGVSIVSKELLLFQ